MFFFLNYELLSYINNHSNIFIESIIFPIYINIKKKKINGILLKLKYTR